MATERTLSIIKPDAVSKNIIGKIISRFEDNGLYIEDLRKARWYEERLISYMLEHPSDK